MSIVNEALKKAAKAKDKKEKRKFPRQDLWVLTLTSKHWKRPLFYGGAGLLAMTILGGALWWGLQKSPQGKDIALTAGEIRIPGVPQISPSPSVNLQTQSSRIFEQYQKGLAHYQDERYKEAEQEFLAILAEDPNQPVIHNNLGLVYYAQGKEQEAALAYLAALKMDPNFAEAMNNLGLLYDQQGRAEEAVALYDRALKMKPDYSEAHLNYAVILERLGYLEEARRHYQRFLSRPPSDLNDIARTVQARFPDLP